MAVLEGVLARIQNGKKLTVEALSDDGSLIKFKDDPRLMEMTHFENLLEKGAFDISEDNADVIIFKEGWRSFKSRDGYLYFTDTEPTSRPKASDAYAEKFTK